MLVRLATSTIFCLLLTGCGTQVDVRTEPSGALEVSVLYRERIALPPGAELTVTLSDVSKMDVPETVISSVRRKLSTSPPYRVQLTYDAGLIRERHRYNVRAKITLEDRLLFISTYAIDPFRAPGKQPIEIIVERVRRVGP
jgi:putative lipoprotein